MVAARGTGHEARGAAEGTEEVMLKSIQISLSLVDGGALDLGGEAKNGRELIEALFGYNISPPPTLLLIRARATDGTAVTIRIPYDERDLASIDVEGRK
jgi:hypothetical protein